jgi:hypothetical protein
MDAAAASASGAARFERAARLRSPVALARVKHSIPLGCRLPLLAQSGHSSFFKGEAKHIAAMNAKARLTNVSGNLQAQRNESICAVIRKGSVVRRIADGVQNAKHVDQAEILRVTFARYFLRNHTPKRMYRYCLSSICRKGSQCIFNS